MPYLVADGSEPYLWVDTEKHFWIPGLDGCMGNTHPLPAVHGSEFVIQWPGLTCSQDEDTKDSANPNTKTEPDVNSRFRLWL